jgi:hypothetical protein
MREVGGKAAVDFARGCGRRTDQHGVAPGGPGQEQGARKQVTIAGGDGDVVAKTSSSAAMVTATSRIFLLA